MKNFFKGVGVILLGIVLLYFFLGFAGVIDLQFYKYFGVQKANVQRQIFKENKSYVEGMVSDLAKYKYEYETEKDETAKAAITDLIRSKYANFDISNIEDIGSQNFLREVRNGGIR